jgi:hypothetical protein
VEKSSSEGKMDFDMDKSIETGKLMGLEGTELQAFAVQQQRQALEREERQQERERERDREVRQQEREREENQRRHELELETMKIEQLRLEVKKQEGAKKTASAPVKAPRPKLPPFDEASDDIDAYLERFERYASSQGWEEDDWAVSLSPLLTGKGLQVYVSLPADKMNDYEGLKMALLKRYQMTGEGFRKKFRDAEALPSETAFQFASRLARYLERWIGLAECKKEYDDIVDLLLREQFVRSCSTELALFLGERTPKSIDDVVVLAERYLEAHGDPIMGRKQDSGDQKNDVHKREIKDQDVKENRCFLCHQKGHMAYDCLPSKNKGKKNVQKAAGATNKPVVNEMGQRQAEDPYTGEDEAIPQRVEVGSALTMLEDCIEDGRLKLANGSTVPVVLGACDGDQEKLHHNNMPVVEGFVGSTQVAVLRDTGCSSVAVKMDLVKKEQLTGKVIQCALIDGTIRRFPAAKIKVKTPFFTGECEAMCMESPMYDLILGNIPGCNGTGEMTRCWNGT